MTDYEQLKSNYICKNSEGCEKQIIILDEIKAGLLKSGRTFNSLKLNAPSAEDYQFFRDNFQHLTPLFIEKYGDRQDVYCINTDNPEAFGISVFSEDGVVQDWNTTHEFTIWLIEDSGYLS